MAHELQQEREIAIFWDYENVPLPENCNATAAAKAIADAVSPQYGRIVDRRLYVDFDKMNLACSSLASQGFVSTNTPTRNQKETVDKKLIADVLTFAWDSAVRNDVKKPCVVLLTNDGDYAYTLSKLRDRGIMTVVMVGKDCTVASILVDTAEVAMSLEYDVLQGVLGTTTTSTTTVASTPNGRTDKRAENDLTAALCRYIRHDAAQTGWAAYGTVATKLQTLIRTQDNGASPDHVKTKAKAVRQAAENRRLIEIGRRKLDSTNEIIASPISKPYMYLSNEVYARLLPAGESLIGKRATGTDTRVTSSNIVSNKKVTATSPTRPSSWSTPSGRGRSSVFVRGLHPRTQVRELVQALEETCRVNVRRARLVASSLGKSPCYNGHVELFKASDASIVLQAANRSTGGKGIYVKGRAVGVVTNTRTDMFDTKGDHTVYYEIGESVDAVPPSVSTKSDTEEDTSNDATVFCVSLYLVATASRHGTPASSADSWTNSGAVGMTFRARCSMKPSVSKEDANARFKAARDKAIEAGYIELGRKRLEPSSRDEPGYVAVPLYSSTPTRSSERLSPELYLRLLPAGISLALENAPPRQREQSSSKVDMRKHVYLNNLPKTTEATQLVEFFEASYNFEIRRIELVPSNWKDIDGLAAHVEFVNTDEANQVVQKARSGGLVYCGRLIYAVPDRTTADKIPEKSTNPDMSYTKEEAVVASLPAAETASSSTDDGHLQLTEETDAEDGNWSSGAAETDESKASFKAILLSSSTDDEQQEFAQKTDAEDGNWSSGAAETDESKDSFKAVLLRSSTDDQHLQLTEKTDAKDGNWSTVGATETQQQIFQSPSSTEESKDSVEAILSWPNYNEADNIEPVD